MSFLWPDMLWLLTPVPALVAAYLFLLGRKKKTALRYANLNLVKEAMAAGVRFRRHIPPLLLLLALTLLILAVARPSAVVTLPTHQRTVILAMDTSGSMRATDVEPSRMAAAQAAAKSFVSDQPRGTRIGVSAATAYQIPVTINVLANDADPEGSALTVATFSQPANGTVTRSGNNLVYTPFTGFSGINSLNYTVQDAGGAVSNAATVTVTVAAPAVAVDLGISRLTVTAVGNAVNGLVELAGGNVLFTPATNFSGPASFQYTVNDGNGGNASGTVNVTVTPINDPPVARDDSAATAYQTPVTINVLANDADPEGSALSVATFTQGANGTVSRSGNNLVYTPNTGFSGINTFTYRVRDSGGATSNTATVTVTVAAPAVAVDLDISRLTGLPIAPPRRNAARWIGPPDSGTQ